MVEKLLDMAKVRLYGEKISDMKYGDPPSKEPLGFVRVYGYAFEGQYYTLDTPTIMLLEGAGTDLKASGMSEEQMKFMSSDLKEWECDKSDQSTRLEDFTGSIEEILLEFELDEDDHQDEHHDGRVSGGRVSGGRVSGGRVSGGRVSGGRVSGGRVSGAKDD
ncbi:MAG: hypothetical protein ACI8VW_000779 [bacterium]|jgi:hypothetical protein